MTGIVEPMGSQLEKSLMVGRTAIKAKARTPVRLMNLNNFPAALKTGTQIAGLSTIVSIVKKLNTVSREETGCSSELVGLVPTKPN